MLGAVVGGEPAVNLPSVPRTPRLAAATRGDEGPAGKNTMAPIAARRKSPKHTIPPAINVATNERFEPGSLLRRRPSRPRGVIIRPGRGDRRDFMARHPYRSWLVLGPVFTELLPDCRLGRRLQPNQRSRGEL